MTQSGAIDPLLNQINQLINHIDQLISQSIDQSPSIEQPVKEI